MTSTAIVNKARNFCHTLRDVSSVHSQLPLRSLVDGTH